MEKRAPRAAAVMAALALLCLYAATAMLAIAAGAAVYADTAALAADRSGARSAAAYLTSRVRGSDSAANSVGLGELDGRSALVLTETVNGSEYITYVWCEEGRLRELYVKAGSGLGADAGVSVAEAAALELTRVGDGLIKAVVTGADGTTAATYIAVRSGAEALS